MAFVANELYREDFTSEDLVVVNHSLGREYLTLKVLIDDVSRPDLISRVIIDRDDPTNIFAVSLTSAQTGTIQVLETDITQVGQLSASQMVTLGFYDSFVFGEEYTYDEDLGEDSTTSTTLQTKLTLTTASVPTGTYYIEWSYLYRTDNINYDFQGEVDIDASAVWNHNQEPNDAGSDQEIPAEGFAEVDFTAGVHTVDIKWATESAVATAYIKAARIALWRVR